MRSAMWVLRRWIGLRTSHLVAAAALFAVTIASLAAGYWWLGEQADAAIGAPGVLLVFVAYLGTSIAFVVFAAAAAARFLIGRVRRAIGPVRSLGTLRSY